MHISQSVARYTSRTPPMVLLVLIATLVGLGGIALSLRSLFAGAGALLLVYLCAFALWWHDNY